MTVRTIDVWDAGNHLKEGQTVTCYYPDTKTGKPCPRKGEVLKVGEDYVTLDTSRGPRSLKFARMQGTLKIHD